MNLLKDKLEAFLGKYSLYITFAFSAMLIISLTGNLRKIMEARGRVEDIEDRIENVENENKVLKKNLEMAKSEEFMESNLRDELGYVKEGEIVVVLPEDEDYLRSFAPKLPEEEDLLPDPNWKKWMKLFI